MHGFVAGVLWSQERQANESVIKLFNFLVPVPEADSQTRSGNGS